MKIQNEQQVQALQQEEQARRKLQKPGSSFEALLAETMQEAQPAASFQKAIGGLEQQGNPLLGMQLHAAQTLGGIEETGQIAGKTNNADALGVSSLLDQLDKYSGLLSSQTPGSLKAGYCALEDLNKQLADFKSARPDLAAQDPQLASIVNDLEVVAATETFKFNRGDYQ